MNSKRLKLLLLLACTTVAINAQTVFWYDNFDLPAGGAINNNAGAGWTLNSGGLGSNQWYINSGSGISCGSANALHVSCATFVCGFFGGPNTPVYNASVTSNRTAVSPIINTSGRSNLVLSFSWVCFGEPSVDFGKIAFSSNGGSSWSDWPSEFSGTSGCSTFTVNLPEEYANNENFRIRFNWQNDFSNGADPAFFVDNIQLLGVEQACLPPTVDAGQDAQFCGGGAGIGIGGFPTASNGSGNYSYNWSPAVGLSSTSVSNPIASPSQTTSYTVLVTDLDNNCTASDVIVVNVIPAEVLEISPEGAVTICNGESLQIQATGGFSNYVWNTPSGALTGASISATEAGSYQVSATGTNACPSVSNTLQVNVVSPQSLVVSPSGDVVLCSGQSIELIAQTGFTNYLWTGPSTTQTGSAASVTESGSWFVSATDVNGCNSISEPIQITVVQPLVPGLTPDVDSFLCIGSSLSLSADDGFSNYVWTGPDGSIAAQVISASSAGDYFVSATDINGCSTVSEVIGISFFPETELNISPTGDIQLCTGETANLVAGNGFTNYLWNTPPGIVSGQNIAASTPGEYTVSAIDLNGCQQVSETIILSVFPEQALEIISNGTDLCIGEITLSASPGFAQYIWSTPSGTQETPVLEVFVAGNYGLSATDVNGCLSIADEIEITGGTSIVLEVNPSGDLSICPGESIVLQATEGLTNYVWNGLAGSSSIVVESAGTWQVTALSPEGCEAISELITVSVFNVQVLDVSTSGSTNICPGTSVELIAGTGFSDYEWTSGAETVSSISVLVNESSTWQASAIDQNGCLSTSAPVQIILLEPAIPQIFPSGPLALCSGISVTLSASDGFSNYNWTPVNEAGSALTTATAGSYFVSATSAEGCIVQSNEVEIIVFPEPPLIEVLPQGPLAVCEGNQVTLTASEGYTNYLWSNNATGNSIEVTEQSTYIVTATDSNGCAANSQSVFVDVIDSFAPVVNPSGNITVCPGTEIILVAQAGFVNYTWSDQTIGQTLLVSNSGTYSVSVQDSNGCIGVSDNINVEAGVLPEASFTFLQTDGYNVEFTSTSEFADTWLWDFGSGNTSNEENPSFEFLFDNDWPVTLVVSNSCGSDTLNTTVEVIKTSSGDLSQNAIQAQVSYPNVFLSGRPGITEELVWSLYSINGALLKTGTESVSGFTQWILPSIANGIYLMELQSPKFRSIIRFPVLMK